ncbi:DUF2283 domain-containing protein [Stagnimonas aquatica]|uniref:DUF2283 domain-containing protein n=1 Tax=Stagnimonas aquatica TaxID=2689987 RepID=A0A3N0V4V9_9GAMM|nr:DUF2283 domain-containing protein [Stagnimonas aquatica]ROH87836.1 DUF2283 domain-containing protein [Stagnimonas aquatica]
MKMDYNAQDDVLLIRLAGGAVVRDVSLNWNVNLGMTESGEIAEIEILDAKSAGYLPLEISPALKAA